MHVLYLPCTQLSLMYKCLVHSQGKIQKPAVTPRELNLGLLASTTTSELQPPENHQASQSSMCTAKGQLNSCTPGAGRACGNMAESYYLVACLLYSEESTEGYYPIVYILYSEESTETNTTDTRLVGVFWHAIKASKACGTITFAPFHPVWEMDRYLTLDGIQLSCHLTHHRVDACKTLLIENDRKWHQAENHLGSFIYIAQWPLLFSSSHIPRPRLKLRGSGNFQQIT